MTVSKSQEAQSLGRESSTEHKPRVQGREALLVSKGGREVQEGLREDWSLPPPVAETGRRNVPREKERQSRDY